MCLQYVNGLSAKCVYYCILRWVKFNSKGQYKQYSSIEPSKLFEDVLSNGRKIRRWSLNISLCWFIGLESVRKTIIDTYLLERLTIKRKKDHGKLQVRISEPRRCVICAVEEKDESFAQDGSELFGQMKGIKEISMVLNL
ncbi:unnamed protein product [Rhizophagus irregularis]|uniref:Uncharacterized protein n=1 Tax=Rhizophagus irregularis TaxID=588596 RepID=A0A2N1M514_9GLOM|nr:hypothetical protein RhiirC2_799482 [Rhizophagus irregularis]CAB4391387.1 unnamed protein product [Rhizophagus irregularis]CAB5390815.1 unnamed protein product [Rhizophagus irregularis]